jgi:hypothetical protein
VRQEVLSYQAIGNNLSSHHGDRTYSALKYKRREILVTSQLRQTGVQHLNLVFSLREKPQMRTQELRLNLFCTESRRIPRLLTHHRELRLSHMRPFHVLLVSSKRSMENLGSRLQHHLNESSVLSSKSSVMLQEAGRVNRWVEWTSLFTKQQKSTGQVFEYS